MAAATRIGIIGDFNPANSTHLATNEGIEHAAERLEKVFETVWLPTDQSHEFSEFDGLFCSPGSPYKSLEGALEGIRFARENKIAFLGTCGGSQHLVLEYARNVMGFRDAAHAETDPYASCLFITPLSCSLVGKTMQVNIAAGTRAAAIYGATHAQEKYYCNFGLNPEYREKLESAGLQISGTDADCEARIMDIPSHPFFFGTLFVPQTSSTKEAPHPMILEFCRAAATGTTAWATA
jgi:CTP synthase (UTP-ammonia lyase)